MLHLSLKGMQAKGLLLLLGFCIGLLAMLLEEVMADVMYVMSLLLPHLECLFVISVPTAPPVLVGRHTTNDPTRSNSLKIHIGRGPLWIILLLLVEPWHVVAELPFTSQMTTDWVA